jgi:hypothetical protein
MNSLQLQWTTVVLLACSIVVSTGRFATCEVVRIVSPPAFGNAEGNSSVRPNVAPNRLQFFFAASDFAGLPPSQRFLVAFNFRGDRTQTQAVDRIFPDGEWWMSTTSKTGTSLSTVFAENHGPDKTLVHDGLLRFPILGTGPPQGPRDIADGMRLEKPFYYDPSQGNLLIEHIWRTTGSPVPQPTLDLQPTSEFTLLVGGNPDATVGTRFTGYSVLQFEFAAAPPGDFNVDGMVDAADYIVWRKGLGTAYMAHDYDMWRAHFGETAGSGAALPSAEPLPAVPEPSTYGPMGLALMSLFSRRSYRYSQGADSI